MPQAHQRVSIQAWESHEVDPPPFPNPHPEPWTWPHCPKPWSWPSAP